MFTGLIQRIGKVRRVSRGSGFVLEIGFEPWTTPLVTGESIAVDGVCLTVADFDSTRFTANVLRETEASSTLSGFVPGRKVNLERALRAGDAMGGHIVQGHVDAVGSVAAIIPRGRDFRLKIRTGRVFAAGCVNKGSVAVDGVSLTVSSLGDDFFTVDIIPTTAGETILGSLKVGDKVNLESDIIGRYAAAAAHSSSGLTEEALSAAGFL